MVPQSPFGAVDWLRPTGSGMGLSTGTEGTMAEILQRNVHLKPTAKVIILQLKAPNIQIFLPLVYESPKTIKVAVPPPSDP